MKFQSWARELTHIVAAIYALFLAFVGLWPRHVDSGLGLVDRPAVRDVAWLLGVPPGQLVSAGEVAANVVLFIPVGAFVAYRWSGSRVLVAGFAAMAIAMVIETVQWLAPIDRTASALDLIINTVGGCLGFALIRVVGRRPRIQPVVLGSIALVVLGVAGVLVTGLAVSPS